MSPTARYYSDTLLEAFISAGLVGGEGFAVDASLIVADANKIGIGSPMEYGAIDGKVEWIPDAPFRVRSSIV